MSQLSRNVVINALSNALFLGLSLFATRVVNRELGAEVIGLSVFATTVSGVLVSAGDFGMTATLVREVAARGDERAYVRDLVRSAQLVAWATCGALLVAVLFLADFFAERWLTIDASRVPELVGALRFFFISALLVLPRLVYGAVMQGLQEFRLYNAVELSWSVAQQLGTLAIAGLGGRALHIGLWYAVCSAVAVVSVAGFCAHKLGAEVLVPRWSRPAFERTRSFLSHSVAASVFASIFQRLDRLLLSFFLPVTSLAHYGFLASLVAKALSFVSGISRASYPAFSSAAAQGVTPSIEAMFRKVDDLVCLGAVPLFAFAVYFERPVVAYVFGAEVADAMLVPVALLALGSYLNATLHIVYRLALALGKPEIAMRHNAYSLPVVIPISIVLVWQLGVTGAAASWVVYHIFAYIYALPRYWRECFGSGVRARYARIGSTLLVACTLYAPPLALVRQTGVGLWQLCAVFAVTSALFLSVAVAFLASPDVKASIRRVLSLQP